MSTSTFLRYLLLLSVHACIPASLVLSQNLLLDMDIDAHHLYDRMIIRTGSRDSTIHTAIKPFWRHDVLRLAESYIAGTPAPADLWQAQKIWDQNNEWIVSDGRPTFDTVYVHADTYTLTARRSLLQYRRSKRPLWNTFYKTPYQLYEVDVPDFYLRVNPLIQFGAGRETVEGVNTFVNQRGVSLRGGVGKNVFFQTQFYDSQVRLPQYINQYTTDLGVVPGVGLYKNFNSAFFDFSNGRDYLQALAYVGVNFGKYIGMQLGHNQFFIGDGLRSLFLSDFSTPFFSLKFNTRIWKFHYQNIFAEMAADNFMSVTGFSEAIPKKYMAAHYLSYKPTPHLTLGLFEAVIFDRPGHRFELQYLNPVILFRTIEGALGSPDNVLIGFNARADIRQSISVYGQVILDDILVREILDGNLDWWGNKFGHQLGVKYIDAFGLPYLDAQVEWNTVRPYTYSHYQAQSNYSNYKQPLAHPLGANFNEWIFSLRYQATPRLLLRSSLYLIRTGEDADSISFGSNVIVSNLNRTGDFGHRVGQGVATDIMYWSSGVHFELTPGVFLDGWMMLRSKMSAIPERSQETRLFQLGVRYNMARREEIF